MNIHETSISKEHKTQFHIAHAYFLFSCAYITCVNIVSLCLCLCLCLCLFHKFEPGLRAGVPITPQYIHSGSLAFDPFGANYLKIRAGMVGAVGKISAFRPQGPQFDPGSTEI